MRIVGMQSHLVGFRTRIWYVSLWFLRQTKINKIFLYQTSWCYSTEMIFIQNSDRSAFLHRRFYFKANGELALSSGVYMKHTRKELSLVTQQQVSQDATFIIQTLSKDECIHTYTEASPKPLHQFDRLNYDFSFVSLCRQFASQGNSRIQMRAAQRRSWLVIKRFKSSTSVETPQCAPLDYVSQAVGDNYFCYLR